MESPHIDHHTYNSRKTLLVPLQTTLILYFSGVGAGW